MSCSEVMYQAYYPYLYQRPGAAPPVSAHPVPRAGPFTSPFASAAHQYDRFTAQRLQDSHINQPSTSTLTTDPHSHPHSHSSHSALYLHGGGSNTPSATSTSSLTGGGISSAAVSAAAAAAAVAAAAPQQQQQSSLVGPGGPHSSAGSVSSTGGISPTSPHRGKEEDCSLHGRSSTEVTHHGGLDEDDSDDDTSSRAQYVSANCVVFTHYQGDASSVVDEHFSRALDKTTPQGKETSPMSQRNFPASFWNSHYQPTVNITPGTSSTSGSHHSATTDLYSEHYHPGDSWYHQYSSHHRAVHEYHQHHHNMAAAAGYGGLLLPPGSRLHVGAAHAHAQCKAAVDWQHAPLEPPYPSAYAGMSGLEAQVQETSKDLYWF